MAYPGRRRTARERQASFYHQLACLWLKNLNPLVSTGLIQPEGLWVGSTSGRDGATGRVKSVYTLQSNRDPKVRSKTFPGVACAMAAQWMEQIGTEQAGVPA